MVAKITTPGTIGKALNYNEKKVQKGVAQCLFAGNFLKDAHELSFGEKLRRFEGLNALNMRAKTNTLHISLNFAPSENLAHEKLIQIANAYLAKIGFGEQPYLVYEHRDAGHPHIHIVTTTIQENGRRIDTYNIGKNQSQTARKEIEKAFGLVAADGKKVEQRQENEPTVTQKIRYGKTDTKKAIADVLWHVLPAYNYSSLPELNAVLKLYNLAADPGTENSRIRKNNGLLYRILNEKGAMIGVPIKASTISFKPTLAYLEKQFRRGAEEREPYKQKLKTALDFQLRQQPDGWAGFIRRMQGEKVTVVLRKNSNDLVYGLTYVDHRTKSVFNGSDLGKSYSAAGVQQRIAVGRTKIEGKKTTLPRKPSGASQNDQKPLDGAKSKERLVDKPHKAKEVVAQRSDDLLHQLLKTEPQTGNVPYELRKKQKKRNTNL